MTNGDDVPEETQSNDTRNAEDMNPIADMNQADITRTDQDPRTLPGDIRRNDGVAVQ